MPRCLRAQGAACSHPRIAHKRNLARRFGATPRAFVLRSVLLAASLGLLVPGLTPVASAATYRERVLGTDGLVSYWSLGESGGGVAVDEKGGNTGTYLNGPALGSPGLLVGDDGTAVGFDGVNDAVRVPGSTSLQPASAWTIGMWLRPAGTACPTHPWDSVRIGVTVTCDGAINVRQITSAGDYTLLTPGGTVVADRTVYVTITWDGATLSVFRDATAVASRSVTGTMQPTTYNVIMGAESTGYEPRGSYYRGTMGHVALYRRALTAGEIRDNAAAGYADDTPPDTEIGAAPAATSSSTAASFTLTSSESGSSYECRLDDGPWADCTASPTLTGLPSGVHTFAARAMDRVLNRDQTPATHTWTVEPSAYEQAVLATDGVLDYWRLGGGPGTTVAADATGRNHGAFVGGAAVGAHGLLDGDVDTATQFDGIDDAASIPSSATLRTPTAFTWEMWVLPRAVKCGGVLFMRPVYYASWGCNHDVRLSLYDGAAWTSLYSPTGLVAAGERVHLAFTWDGAFMRIFKNGVEVAARATAPLVLSESSYITTIGAGNSGYVPRDGYFDGRIDDAALYTRALTAAELKQHVDLGAPPPANVGAPSIAGVPRDGSTLTARSGAWSGTAPIAYAFQWRRCDADGAECTDVPGATSAAYQLSDADVGHALRAVVSATNSAGSTAAATTATTTIEARAPSNASRPTVSGNPRNGETLSADRGAWDGTSPLTFTYTWRRCDTEGADCQDVAGETSPTYVLGPSDVGRTLRVSVSARNDAGERAASSETTEIVRSRTAPPQLVAAYGLDGDTFTDDSGNDHPGIVTGATPTDAGRYGAALSFDGAPDRVEVEDVDDLGLTEEGTVEAWVRPRTDGYQPLFGNRSATGRPTHDGDPSFTVWAEHGWVNGQVHWSDARAPLSSGRWTHVAYEWDAAGSRLFIDGKFVDGWGVETSVDNTAAPLRIGSDGENSFDGLIDEVRVYSGALAADAVARDAHLRVRRQNVDDEPLASYGFEQSTGSVAIDATGRGRHAELQGAGWSSLGRHGRALSLDDDSDRMVTPEGASPADSTFTVEMAVRPRTQPDQQLLASQAGADRPRFELRARGTDSSMGPEARIASGDGVVTLTAPHRLPLREWSHLTLRRDQNTASLLLNGDVVSIANIEPVDGEAGPITIGSPPDSPTSAFDGLVDDVRIYGDAVSDAQATLDADSAVDADAQTDADPILALGFEDRSPTIAADASGHANDAALDGAEFMAGRFGQGVGLEGDDSLGFQDSSSLRVADRFTVEAWVRPRDRSGEPNPVFSQPAGNDTAVELDAGSSDRPPSARIGDVTVSSQLPLPAGRWSHLAITWDGAAVSLIVGDDTVVVDTATERPRATGAPALGVRSDGKHYVGRIDEVRVYDDALSIERIRSEADQPVPEASALLPEGGAGTGTPDGYTFKDFELGGDVLARVNVADGNLVVAAHPSITTGISVQPVYNSMRAGAGDMGLGMGLSMGGDVRLAATPEGSRVLRGPAGYLGDLGVPLPGPPDPSQDSRTPYSSDPLTATPFVNADGTETVSYGSGDRLTFASAPVEQSPWSGRGAPLQLVEQGDQSWRFNYDDDGLTSIDAPDGGQVSIDAGDGRVSRLADDVTAYEYHYADGVLTSISRDDQSMATLEWSDGRLTKIAAATTGSLTFDYDDSGRVRRVIHEPNGGDVDATTFSYDIGDTEVQQGDDSSRFDWELGTLRVTAPDHDAPELNLHTTCDEANSSRRIKTTDDGATIYTDGVEPDYIPGTWAPPLCYEWAPTDALSGIRTVYWNDGIWFRGEDSCLRAIPGPFGLIDSLPGPVGPPAHDTWMEIRLVDCAGNSSSYRIDVVADRTAPSAPTKVKIARPDTDTSTATVSWIPGDDPDLPGDHPGSGAVKDEYRYRQGPTQPWSEWQDGDSPEAELTDLSADPVSVQVRSIDAVGNIGAAAEITEPGVSSEGADDEDLSAFNGRSLTLDVSFGDTADDKLPAADLPVNIQGPLEASTRDEFNIRTSPDGTVTFKGLAAGTYVVTPMGGASREVDVRGDTTHATARLSDPIARLVPESAATKKKRYAYCPTNPVKYFLLPSDRILLCTVINDAAQKALHIAFTAYWPRPDPDPEGRVAAYDGTIANAVQHALWNALIVDDLYQTGQPELYSDALHFTRDIYEYEQQRDPSALIRRFSQMDVHNNIVGHRFARHRLERDGSALGRNGVRLCQRLLRHAVSHKEQGRFKAGTSTWRWPPASNSLVYLFGTAKEEGTPFVVKQVPHAEDVCLQLKNYHSVQDTGGDTT